MSNTSDRFIPIVLCAGLGTRLAPLTHFIPKVVCPIINKPIAFFNIEKLFQAGFETVHCNVHYLAETVKAELTQAAIYFGYDPKRIVFWHEDTLLETGGGIAHIFSELQVQDPRNSQKDIIVVSGDLIAEFPIEKMIQVWQSRKTDEVALMGTRKLIHERKDMTWVSQDFQHVIGFGEKYTQEAQKQNAVARLFSNHQIIDHEVVKKAKVEKKASVAMFFQTSLEENKKIIHFQMNDDDHWFNVGTVPEYLDCIHFFNKDKSFKGNDFIVNHAHHMPDLLKEKIDAYLKNGKHNDDFPAQNSIVISFFDGQIKKDIYLPVHGLLNLDPVVKPRGDTLENHIAKEDFYFYI